MLNAYAVLGLHPTATEPEIKAAFRRLARRHHPDTGTADPAMLHRVQEAYRLLCDPVRRRELDTACFPTLTRRRYAREGNGAGLAGLFGAMRQRFTGRTQQKGCA